MQWTREEDNILIQSRINNNLSYAKTARLLKERTVNSVRHRWEKIKDRIDLNKVLYTSKEREGGPKILIYDIETSPLLAYSWGIYTQFIRPENVVKDWFVISWAGKWLYDDNIQSDVLTSKEAKDGDDKRIVSGLWKLFDEADIIVSHNGDRFDQRKMNWRFLTHGFPPPMNYKTVDTIKVARKYFSATSNKLDYLTDSLNIGRKLEHEGLEMWIKCMNGDSDSLKDMLTYNEHDVLILENLYLELLPWITNHPNLGLFSQEEISICPNCGGEIEVSEKLSTTSVNAYYQYRCKECSHVGRTKIHATTLEKRKELVSN